MITPEDYTSQTFLDAYRSTKGTAIAVPSNPVPSKSVASKVHNLWILTVAALGMSTLLALLADTGHDQLWLLLAAQRLLLGSAPHLNPYGPTVFESNPPLAIWVSAIVVRAASLLHLSLTVTLKLAVTLLAIASATISGKLLRRLNPALTRDQLWLLGIAFVFIFGAVPARDFGQRDHILALLVLPYLVAAALRPIPVPARVFITLIAALGIALKPHQTLIPIAVELAILLSSVPHVRRSLTATKVGIEQSSTAFRILEPALFLATALTYLAAIHFLAPTYLTEILPILRQTYWAFGRLPACQLLQAAPAIPVLLAANIALSIYRRPPSPLIPILLAAGTAATVAYFAQGTGWYYQQLPAISFLALAVSLQITEALSDSSKRIVDSSRILPFLLKPLAGLTLLAFALTIHFSNFHLTPRGIEQAQSTPDPTYFADLPPNAPVATLTTSVDDTVPAAFRYHVTLAQRYPHLWMLPAILRNESGSAPSHPIAPAELQSLDRLQHRFMVEDLQRWHPTLILVQRCQDPAVRCQVLEDRHDDLLAWFLRDPAFAALFRQYHFLRSSGPYDAYKLTSPIQSTADERR